MAKKSSKKKASKKRAATIAVVADPGAQPHECTVTDKPKNCAGVVLIVNNKLSKAEAMAAGTNALHRLGNMEFPIA